MARVLIGNFKGPKGDNGEKGDPGPQGPKGEQGNTGLVNADGIIEFEDYLETGAVLPTPEEALAGIASGMSLKSVISNIKAFLKVGGTGTEIISDKFSENKDYVVGDYAIRDNTLYRFVLDKAVGKWDETAVEPTTAGAEFQNLNAKMGAKSDLEWKKIGSGALQARVNLPVEFNEILAICDVKANSSTGGYSVIIPRGEITSTDAAFYTGSYLSSGYQVMFSVNTESIRMSRCMQDNNNVSGAKARYYYR